MTKRPLLPPMTMTMSAPTPRSQTTTATTTANAMATTTPMMTDDRHKLFKKQQSTSDIRSYLLLTCLAFTDSMCAAGRSIFSCTNKCTTPFVSTIFATILRLEWFNGKEKKMVTVVV